MKKLYALLLAAGLLSAPTAQGQTYGDVEFDYDWWENEYEVEVDNGSYWHDGSYHTGDYEIEMEPEIGSFYDPAFNTWGSYGYYDLEVEPDDGWFDSWYDGLYN